MSSLLGKAGSAGLGKAVEVLDQLGRSMTSLNMGVGFVSSVTSKGNKISILAFEVASTIVKGANLMQSLSNDNIKHLKEVVLPSKAVQNLISKDVDELLRIAAADKREELKVFSWEVVRFGNRCKDPKWHNLDRYFEKLALELTPQKQLKEDADTSPTLKLALELTPQKQLKEDADTIMQQLMMLARYTAELYHKLHTLDRFEQDYGCKLQEDNRSTTHRGNCLALLRAELKSQRKQVRGLKKKSLWSKMLEEVVEKLVHIVRFLHLAIHEAFDTDDGDRLLKTSSKNYQKLESADLALHYANIITQINTLVCRSNSVPPNLRDALYQGLPPTIKSALRSKLQSFEHKEELTIPLIQSEMEKTLQWLVPFATNTIKALHGFGWVGKWANTGSDGSQNLIRIETLHHADKAKTEAYILDLVVWLHQLASLSRTAASSETKSPVRSPNQNAIHLSPHKPTHPSPTLAVEGQEMLCNVAKRKFMPGISKSPEFKTVETRVGEHHRLSKSNGHSPTRESKEEAHLARRPSL